MQVEKIDSQKALRDILASELKRRSETNPRYSMRSFAKFLELSPSYLLRILRGNHQISGSTFERLLSKLRLDHETEKRIRANFEKPRRKRISLKYAPLDSEKLKVVGQWYYFAILALLEIDDFELSAKWIARRLNISESSAQEAIDRLIRLNMVAKNDDGKWIQQEGPHSSTRAIPGTTAALKDLQRQYLELSENALQSVPIERRTHSGLTVSFEAEQIGYIKSEIDKLRTALHQKIRRSSKKPNSVYQLSISFFPLTEANP